MKSYILFIIISIIINFVFITSDDECKTQSNTNCQSCLNISGCAYCKKSKECFKHSLTNPTCSTSETQYVTCLADTQTWLIVLGSVGGVVLLAVIVVICCFCRKCKQRSLRKERKKEIEEGQQMEERRAAAELRSAERHRAADEIRMKYGLLKDKDSHNSYRRMS